MRNLNETINEELIFEFIIGFLDLYKISLDLVPHAQDRQTRKDKQFISKYNISNSIAKVAKEIRDDFELNNIQYKDRIKILDKSRDKHLNILCDINEDSKKKDWIKLSIITVMEDDMPTHNIKKTYITYSSDSKVKDDIKMIKNMI